MYSIFQKAYATIKLRFCRLGERQKIKKRGYMVRGKKVFLQKKLKFLSLIATLCLGGALLVYGGLKIFAAIITDDEARVNEDDTLIYYITVNSDGIDREGTASSETVTVDEVSGTTTVTDILPEGLIFQGFVTSPDGTFGAVERNDRVTQCAGAVIDDTNEESVEEGLWSAGNAEYTYHGLHYDASTRTVTFRTRGIGAGCELTVGVITKTPTLPDGVFRMDFYDHASFVDESLFGDSNEVHAWIQKDVLPGEYSLTYVYEGNVPEGAPEVPEKSYYDTSDAAITIAPQPTLEGYTFIGWKYRSGSGGSVYDANNLTQLPGSSLTVFGTWETDGGEPVPDPPVSEPTKYNVTYEVDGEKPARFKTPAKRSYYEGASVNVDSTNSEGDNIDGYDFSGWSTDDVTVSNDSFTMPKKNVLLRGSFDQDTYTLSYEFVGDVAPENAASLLPASSEHHAGDQITLAALPTAEGYTFHGWYADPNFEMPAQNVVIQGEWEKNKIEFTPGIDIEITNPKDLFYKGDTVEFKVTVTNDEDFALTNVWLEEVLNGAVFVEGDNYTVGDEPNFAEIANIPANSSAVVYAKYPVTKNIEKVYTNTVELISLDSTNDDYVLPLDWNNSDSVDFATGVISDIPEDEDDEQEEPETPKTFDGGIKAIISGAILAGGLAACVVLLKRTRRGGIVYGYCVAIMGVAGLAVVLVNGGHIFADNLSENAQILIRSGNAAVGEAGSWTVRESARWTGAGEATLQIEASSPKISDLHNKDVVLLLDNSYWTAYTLNGTIPQDGAIPSMEVMKQGASEFVTELLSDGDSKVIVIPVYGDNSATLTGDTDAALEQINAISTSNTSNSNSYSDGYDKVLSFLDTYEQSANRALNIIFISDDHTANSGDIAKYKMIKSKAPNSTVSGIGLGVMELLLERYPSAEAARENGVYLYWEGEENPLATGPFYRVFKGLYMIADQQEDPWASEFVSAMTSAADCSESFDKFNVSTAINTTDFDIWSIYGTIGSVDVSDGVVTWKNEDKKLVSGHRYVINVVLKAKDETVSLHKLYKLNNSATVEVDAVDIPAETVTSNENVVLMNGYQLTFATNNEAETCSLGENTSKVYLAWQEIDIDEDGVSCDGWNFINFKDSMTGDVFGATNNKMPAADTTLNATWRKIDVEVHMDGEVHTVAPAVLANGYDFNQKMYSIMNDSAYIMVKAEGCPESRMQESNRISDPESPTDIYAWRQRYNSIPFVYESYSSNYDYSYNNVAFYCTNADEIYLNENVKGMFTNGSSIYDDQGNSQYYQNNVVQLVDGMNEWNTANVKDMSYMFYRSYLGVNAFKALSDWDTSNVEKMDYTFANLNNMSNNQYKENALDIDTSNVTSMKGIFSGSSYALEDFGGIANWNVEKVKDLSYAFGADNGPKDFSALANWEPKSLENLESTFVSGDSTSKDLSYIADWDVSKVTNMKNTFGGLVIEDLNVLSGWDTSSVTTFESTFANAKITSDDVVGSVKGVGSWDPSNVTTISSMFKSSNVSDLSDLSHWGDEGKSTNKITDLSYAFSQAKLTNLNGLQTWDTSAVTNMSYAFAEKSGYVQRAADLVPITDLSAISGWNVGNVTNMSYAFAGTNPNNLQALANWNVGNVTNMSYAFCGGYQRKGSYDRECDDITTNRNDGNSRERHGGPKSLAGLESWNTTNVTNMQGIFAGGEATDLTPIANWDVSNVTNLSKAFMWLGVTDFKGIYKWNTPNVTDLSYTFAHTAATTLAGLDGVNGDDAPGADSHRWDVSKVTTMEGAFKGMLNLTSISALSAWHPTTELNKLDHFLEDHKLLASLDGLGDWNVSSVNGFGWIFKGYATMDVPAGTPHSLDNNSKYTNWTTGCGSALTDISALQNWDVSGNGSGSNGFWAAFACNNHLTSVSALSGWRMEKVQTMAHMFEADSSITSLAGLENWYSNADSLQSNTKVNLAFMFAKMTNLTDISALENWTSNKIKVSELHSFMRMDGNITDGATRTYLQNTFLSTAGTGSVRPSNSKDYAFTGVNGLKPTWWNPVYQ